MKLKEEKANKIVRIRMKFRRQRFTPSVFARQVHEWKRWITRWKTTVGVRIERRSEKLFVDEKRRIATRGFSFAGLKFVFRNASLGHRSRVIRASRRVENCCVKGVAEKCTCSLPATTSINPRFFDLDLDAKRFQPAKEVGRVQLQGLNYSR